MIEDTKWVKSIEAKPGGKSGTYWVVTWHDDKTDRLFDSDMMATCEKAQTQGLAIHLTKEKSGNYWNIKSVELTADKLQEAGKMPDEKPKETNIEPTPREPAPQAVGMITKEIGDHIRAGTLTKIFGAKIAANLVTWYRSQTLGITRINFDGNDLPKFGDKE